MSSTFVILDSSALIAQINVKDLWHKKANTVSEFVERTDRKVILPAEVLAEHRLTRRPWDKHNPWPVRPRPRALEGP